MATLVREKPIRKYSQGIGNEKTPKSLDVSVQSAYTCSKVSGVAGASNTDDP